MPELSVGAKDLLLVIDVQRDFCPGGALAVPDGDAVVPLINQLSARFPHVALTQDWHPRGHASFASSYPGKAPYERVTLAYGEQVLWPDHCVTGTLGAAFHEALDTTPAELIVRKGYRPEVDSYSAFFENDRETRTGLCGALMERGLTRLFVVGLATDFCVAYSALDAVRLGFAAVVLEDATRAIDLEGSLDEAWARMERAGVTRARSSELKLP